MGHTHDNELANDGATISMATRSTGHIEEGPRGFSIAAVDGRRMSWRFKPLNLTWPLVLITHSTDGRLATQASRSFGGASAVRANIPGDAPIIAVEMRLDDGTWMPVWLVRGDRALWEASAPANTHHVTVRTRDPNGRSDEDQLEPAGAGPNRNGRKW